MNQIILVPISKCELEERRQWIDKETPPMILHDGAFESILMEENNCSLILEMEPELRRPKKDCRVETKKKLASQ